LNETELTELLDRLRALPKENEWVEFKVGNYKPELIGEYISALTNSACLHSKEKGYLVFGIEDETHAVKGTQFRPSEKKVGNEELENWLCMRLNPRIDFLIHEFSYKGKPIAMFEIDATVTYTVKFKGVAYIRVGSQKRRLSEYPEKEKKLWNRLQLVDWSSKVIHNSTLDDLDSDAILKARDEFKNKAPQYADEVGNWDNVAFLNRAGVTRNGKITNTAIILLGKPESAHHISPAIAEVTWLLKDENANTISGDHFGPPLILNVDKVLRRIRNLSFKYLQDTKLFPIEFSQYDTWVIREALHNCIAHQDYQMRGAITIVETPDHLTFENLGMFLPGSIEEVIRRNAPSDTYRNDFLVHAMDKLNMIEKLGGGIYKMYTIQKKRYFPLPDYDLRNPNRVIVKIPGKIIDENYTRHLLEKTDLNLYTVILLDKVQKKKKINAEERKFLRSKNLIEGKFPNIFISASIAEVTERKAQYIKYRGLKKKHYQDLVVDFIKENGSASRKDIDDLLMDILPPLLDEKQKKIKINNLIQDLSKGGRIENRGSRKDPEWFLSSS
jgi:ATP-dependent DNA helicase RecG